MEGAWVNPNTFGLTQALSSLIFRHKTHHLLKVPSGSPEHRWVNPNPELPALQTQDPSSVEG